MSKNTIIACISNLSTAYNLVVINVVRAVPLQPRRSCLARSLVPSAQSHAKNSCAPPRQVQVFVQNQYCGGDHCKPEVSLASTSCLVGAICGQLTFGYIGDLMGRSRALQLTMALSILGALFSAFAVPLTPADPPSIFTFLAITRFFLGLGVGGVYPLSATIAAESASSAKTRGTTSSIVFSMQGIGNVAVPLIALVFVAMFGNPPDLDDNGPSDLGITWRLCLGVGALPGLLLAPFKASETGRPRTGIVVEPSAPAATNHAGGVAGAPVRPSPQPQTTLMQALCMREYWGKLVGCAGGWLLFDITFYGNQLFQARVLQQIFAANKTSAPSPIEGDVHTNRAIQMLIIAGIGLPGYYVAVYFMDRMGRRIMQIQGFFFMFVAFLVLGLALEPLEHLPILMLFIYGLTCEPRGSPAHAHPREPHARATTTPPHAHRDPSRPTHPAPPS